DIFPPGYYFNPTDQQLLFFYLKNKILNIPLPQIITTTHDIIEVNIYEQSPEELFSIYENKRKKRYFFTERERKYPNGSRPNRLAGNGYWKASGTDKNFRNGDLIGYKRALVFYEGSPRNSHKTNWIMHEYELKKA
ncbi:NAM domain-containing protein, partial [Cephalotus follicularis]